MKHLLIVTIFSSFLFTPKIQAEINMKDASYRNSFIDTKEIRRTYNSRSLYSGYFGFGWCSNLEKNLNIINKDITLKNCDSDSPFVLMDESNSLKTRTFENPVTREKIFFKGGTYTHYLQNGEIRVFDRKGQLTNIISEDGSKIALEYNLGILVRLKNNDGLTLQFYFNDTNQIIKIESSDGTNALYLYEKENLIQTVDFKKQSYLFDYNELNNMTRVTYPNKTEENIAYNNDNDRVLKIQLQDNCVDYYDFRKQSNTREISTLTRKCDNKTIHQYIYEFWYKQRSDGLKYLEKYKIRQNTQTLEMTYLPFDNVPVRILKNGKDLITQI
jgi:hypothetical protein